MADASAGLSIYDLAILDRIITDYMQSYPLFSTKTKNKIIDYLRQSEKQRTNVPDRRVFMEFVHASPYNRESLLDSIVDAHYDEFRRYEIDTNVPTTTPNVLGRGKPSKKELQFINLLRKVLK